MTFMATGGIAMAEHVIKSMLCGANLVGVDVPLLIALECRVCRNCRDGGECPVKSPRPDPKWASQRIINLIGAWHNQFLEMMGAMGIREARRLRGEQGRVMFMEDLENDTFLPTLCRAIRNKEWSSMQYRNVWSEVPPGRSRSPTPSRFGHSIGKYTVVVSEACNDCLKCVAVCPEKVFEAQGGNLRLPRDHLCLGIECSKKIESLCAQLVPPYAIRVGLNPSAKALGDKRWTPDLLMSTWYMAETGRLAQERPRIPSWRFRGGFDKLRFVFPKRAANLDLDKTRSIPPLTSIRRMTDA